MNLEPPPLPPPRLSSCPLHPDQPVTGFCASCLRERLAVLDHRKSAPDGSTSTSTAASALKAIFFKGDGSSRIRESRSLLPELRRCKSFSGAKADGIPVACEPQRKSCDVRVRNTLWSLFHQDDEDRGGGARGGGEIRQENDEKSNSSKNLNLGIDEVKEDVEAEQDDEEEEEEEEDEESKDEGEIRALEPEIRVAETACAEQEIVEEEEEGEEEVAVEEDVMTMKDHIHLDAQMKNHSGCKASTAAEKRDFKEIAGSFWLAASVFSKKLQKWRRKKKRNGGESEATSARVERPASSSRCFRETQSEYGYGRRSCDTDPRFSLDAGRISFDEARYSFDEPRASWDGYLIGGRAAAAAAFPRMPLMDSVMEDAPTPLVRRSDNQIPVEEPMNSIQEDPTTPGGSVQTRDYYLDSSSSLRRWQNLDRSTSVRKMVAAAASGEPEETKWISNSKVSPESMDYFLANKIADSKSSNSNSLRDDCSESFETAFRETAAVAGGAGLRKGSKRLRQWSKAWKIWGLIQWRSSSKDDDYDRYCRGNVVDRSFSESWPELRREVNVNGDLRGTLNRRVFRSNSSISSSRTSFSNGTFGGVKSNREANGHSKKRREEFILERNRSARFSPSHFDNGLLRFYLTPLRSSWSGAGSGKSRSRSSHSFARSMLRFY